MSEQCEHKENPDGPCEGEIKSRRAMTAYYWDGNGENPNRDLMLCDYHYGLYEAYWREMWNEYYFSQR